jgi:hypothetical protein
VSLKEDIFYIAVKKKKVGEGLQLGWIRIFFFASFEFNSHSFFLEEKKKPIQRKKAQIKSSLQR